LKVIFNYARVESVMSHVHDRIPLAVHPACVVERCGCGAIHLTIGAVTLRLQSEAFVAIADTIADGATALALREARAVVARELCS
jgi:hypothetical protein